MFAAVILAAALPATGYDVAPTILYRNMVVVRTEPAAVGEVMVASSTVRPVRRVITAPIRIMRRVQPVRRVITAPVRVFRRATPARRVVTRSCRGGS